MHAKPIHRITSEIAKRALCVMSASLQNLEHVRLRQKRDQRVPDHEPNPEILTLEHSLSPFLRCDGR